MGHYLCTMGGGKKQIPTQQEGGCIICVSKVPVGTEGPPELQTPSWGPPHWELPWPQVLCPEVQAEQRGRSEREWR